MFTIAATCSHVSLSLKTGVVQEDFKIAKVIPLFKADDLQHFNNYRPISILPCFSKILEKIFSFSLRLKFYSL